MAFISLFHKNFKKGYIYKNVNIITLIIDDFIVLFNFRILKSKGYFRPFTKYLDKYIQWYNNVRIKNTLGGLSPVQYRLNNVN